MRPRTTGISGGDRPEQPDGTSSQNFRPKWEWKHEEASSSLLVYLPGYVKITITPDYSNRVVKVEGLLLLPVNETFSIPEECDLDNFEGNMDNQFGRGILILKMPRTVVPQPETTKAKDTSKEGSQTTPETSKSQEDEQTDPSRGSTAGFEKQSTEKAGIITPATPAVDGGDEEKLVEKKEDKNDAKGEPTKPENPTENLVQNISGAKEEGRKEQSKESTTPSATAPAKVEGKEKESETEKGNVNVSAKKGMVKELNEDSKLMINMGVAALIIIGVGASLLYTLMMS